MRMICTNEITNLKTEDLNTYSLQELKQMQSQCLNMLKHEPFPLAMIHDSAWTYPGDMNVIRKHFIAIMAEIADSTLLQDMLREVTGVPDLSITKDSEDLAVDIRKCNYPLS